MMKKTIILAAISMLGGTNITLAQYQGDYNANDPYTYNQNYQQQAYQQQQTTGGVPQIQMQRGRTFTYALPAGWSGDDGQNSVTITSPDRSAFAFTVGITGMLQQMSPDQFMAHALRMCNITDARIINARRVQPAPGCADAAEFEVAYTVNGVPCRGWALSNIALGYNQCNGSLVFAASQADRWDHYRTWLPQVAMQTVASGPNAFGSATTAQQNLDNSRAFGRQLQDHRDHSFQQQQELAAARQRSFDNQRDAMGQMMTNNQWMNDPYGGQPQYQSMTPSVHWINPQGQVVTSHDPSFDPRTPSDQNWQRMTPQGR